MSVSFRAFVWVVLNLGNSRTRGAFLCHEKAEANDYSNDITTMGLLSDILGIQPVTEPQIPEMVSVLPETAVSLINSGQLPTLNVPTLMLNADEKCHYVDKACLVVSKTVVTHYDGTRGGMSINVMKGVTLRGGKSRTTPVREKVTDITPGYLYITSRRIVFASQDNAFEKNVSALTSTTPYSNAIGLQFGNLVYNLLLPTPIQAFAAIKLICGQNA